MEDPQARVLSTESVKAVFYLTAANVTLWLGATILQVLLLSEVASLKYVYICVYIGTGWSILMHAVTVASLYGLYNNTLSHIKAFSTVTDITVVLSILVFSLNVTVFILLIGYTTISLILGGFIALITLYIFFESGYMAIQLKKEIRIFIEKERMFRVHKRLNQHEFFQAASEFQTPVPLDSLVETNIFNFQNNTKFKYQQF